VAIVAHKHENEAQKYFEAAIALDIWLLPGETTKSEGFKIPFMHQAKASQIPLDKHNYQLLKNGYLVAMSPSVQDADYSGHMNFTDLSTLQYVPALKLALDYTDPPLPTRYLGNGNGWNIAHSVNIYLVTFFDTFLKGEVDPTLKMCGVLTNFTYLRCGPDTIGG
jgi:hypothetical protein